jgi:Lon protease-like protein
MAAAMRLPLFPLQTVVFPRGLLTLKVFEPRYLDLVTECLREGKPFGAITIQPPASGEGRPSHAPRLERIGVRAELIEADADAERPGLLHVRCRGTERFEVLSTTAQADGLRLAEVKPLPADEDTPPTGEFLDTVRALANAIASLKAQGTQPFLAPYRFDEAGWVANRWCELLPIPLAAKQRLMELDDPLIRLKLVDEFLRGKGVLG